MIFAMAMAAILNIGTDDIRSSESPSRSDASHCFSSNLFTGLAGDVVWTILRRHGSHLWYQNGPNLAILSLPNASHQVWAKSDLAFRSKRGLRIFNLAAAAAIFERFYKFWIFPCPLNASHQVSAQRFGRRCRLNNFKIATMAAILNIGSQRH